MTPKINLFSVAFDTTAENSVIFDEPYPPKISVAAESDDVQCCCERGLQLVFNRRKRRTGPVYKDPVWCDIRSKLQRGCISGSLELECRTGPVAHHTV
jgi:hypothetical protein